MAEENGVTPLDSGDHTGLVFYDSVDGTQICDGPGIASDAATPYGNATVYESGETPFDWAKDPEEYGGYVVDGTNGHASDAGYYVFANFGARMTDYFPALPYYIVTEIGPVAWGGHHPTATKNYTASTVSPNWDEEPEMWPNALIEEIPALTPTVTDESAAGANDGSIQLDWVDLTDPNGVVTGYKLYRRTGNYPAEVETFVASVAEGVQTYTVNGLAPGYYKYVLQPVFAMNLHAYGRSFVSANVAPAVAAMNKIIVNTPVATDEWGLGETHDIDWQIVAVDTPDASSVNITLERWDGGSVVETQVIDTGVSNTGPYAWSIPWGSMLGTDNLTVNVEFTTNGGGNTYWNRSANFTIVANNPPTVTLTFPNGGETFLYGSAQTVTYTTDDTDIDNIVKLFINVSNDGFATSNNVWTWTGTGTPPQSHLCTVVVPPSTTCEMMVTVIDNASAIASDVSDGTFTVTNNNPLITYTGATLSGGMYYVGETINLDFSVSDVEDAAADIDVDIWLVPDASANYGAWTNLMHIATVAGDASTFAWTLTAGDVGTDLGILLNATDLNGGTNNTIADFDLFAFDVKADLDAPTAWDFAMSDVTITYGIETASTASVTFNDTESGNADIQAAEYALTATTTAPVGAGIAMTAVDALDSPLEDFTASVDFTGQIPGDYFVWVRGQDTENNWSPWVASNRIQVDVVDTTAPFAEINFANSTVSANVPESTSITIWANASDNYATDINGKLDVYLEYTTPVNAAGNKSMFYSVGDDFFADIGMADLEPGVLSYCVVAFDGALWYKSATYTATIYDDVAPKANAGTDQTVNEDVLVTFNGALSFDGNVDGDSLDHGIANYWWNFTDGAAQSLTGVGPTYTFATPGVFTVTLTVMDPAGLKGTDTVVITVTDITAPTANAGPDQTVAEGVLVTFVGSASSDNSGTITNYWWNFTDGAAQSLTGVGPTYTFATPGVFTVTLTVMDAKGLKGTDTVVITVTDTTAPTANAGPDQTVSEDDLMTFDGSGSSDPEGGTIANYWWNFTDGAAQSLTGVGPTYTFATPGVFTVTLTVMDAVGLKGTDTVDITVTADNFAPTADAGADITVKQNVPFQLNGNGSSDSDGFITNYTWEVFDATWTLMTTFYGEIVNVTGAPTMGIFTVNLTVTDNATTPATDVDSMTITVTDGTAPTVVVTPATATVAQGGFVVFTANATDNVALAANMTYTWYVNGAVVLTGVNETELNHAFAAAGTATVLCEVEDLNGNVGNDTATVTVTDTANPSVSVAPATATIDMGEYVVFTCTATDNVDAADLMTYTWFVDGLQVLTGVNETEFNQTFTVAGAYVVLCEVEDAAGNVANDTSAVTVLDIEAPTVTITPDLASPQAPGTEVNFTAAATDNVDSATTVTYLWSLDGTATTVVTAYYVHNFTAPGTYNVSVEVTDTAGNVGMDYVHYVINDITDPTADAGADQAVAAGATVTFDGSASADDVAVANYTWTFTHGTAQTLYGDAPTFVFTTVGSYLVTLTVADAAGNSASDTMYVNVTDQTAPVANAGADQTVDQGTLVTFDGSASTDNVGIATYTWTFADGKNATGVDFVKTLTGVSPTYTFDNVSAYVVTLTVADAAGNTHTDTVTITTTDAIAPVANAGADQTVVEDVAVDFDATASTDNIGVANYTWTFVDGATNVTLYGNLTTYTFATVGTYTVTLNVTDAAGHYDVDTVTITVTAANSAPTADAGADQAVQSGAVVTFTGAGSADPDADTLTYSWTFTYGTAQTLTGVGPTFTFVTPGVYTVTLTVNDGTHTDTDTMTVTVTDTTLPTITTFEADVEEIVPGGEVTFTAAATDAQGVTYLWTITDADGTEVATYTTATATHTFADAGEYTVTLTVTDASGNEATDTLTVTVAEEDDDDDGSLCWLWILIVVIILVIVAVVVVVLMMGKKKEGGEETPAEGAPAEGDAPAEGGETPPPESPAQ